MDILTCKEASSPPITMEETVLENIDDFEFPAVA